MSLLYLVGAFIAVAVFVSVQSAREAKAKILRQIRNNWGKRETKKYRDEDMEKIRSLADAESLKAAYFVDDITWDDLNMDDVFAAMNNTGSGIGQEVLYRNLRIPRSDEGLAQIDRIADYYGTDANEKERVHVQQIFAEMGKPKKAAIYDYIEVLGDLKRDSNLPHILAIVLIIAAVGVMVGVNAQIGMLALIGALGYAILSYYKIRAKHQAYFVCVKLMASMAKTVQKLAHGHFTGLEPEQKRLDELAAALSDITRFGSILESGNVNGSIVEMFLDYFRMMFHLDLLVFNRTVEKVREHAAEVYEAYELLGTVDSSIAVASFRTLLGYWCKPEIVTSAPHSKAGNSLAPHAEARSLVLEDAYHPLIENPVANSISTQSHVLLTGSNASGKSTFLRTVAISAILAETIFTVPAKRAELPKYRIYSSMSLKDSLATKSSYYMVEVQALKRILDAAAYSATGDEKLAAGEKDAMETSASAAPVLCFVDEILRGTNTVERIAASSEIMRYLAEQNALVFAATHDIELTKMLDGPYTNYHFQEDVQDDGISFSYEIHLGPAVTRNAIKLLKVMGYDERITEAAEEKAHEFLEKGSWS